MVLTTATGPLSACHEQQSENAIIATRAAEVTIQDVFGEAA